MGMELIDFLLRLEDRLGVRLEFEDLETLNCQRGGFDVTVDAVCGMVESKLGLSGGPAPTASRADGNEIVLDYAGPARRHRPVDREEVFVAVTECIATAVRMPVSSIRRESRLVSELGMN